MTTDIVQHAAGETAIVAATNPLLPLLTAVIQQGVTTENATAIEKLAGLFKDMEADRARRDFAGAFAGLQRDLPKIAAMRVIPNNDKTVRSTFAAFEDIMDVIGPHLARHGFSVSFDSDYEDANGKSRVVAICILTHVSGHSEQRRFACRTSPPPKASEAQADGATLTYAKRMALCNMFNLSIDRDTDARAEGDFITRDQAAELERRVVSLGAGCKAFLDMAGAASFAEIREGSYGTLCRALAMKERAHAMQTPHGTVDKLYSELEEMARSAGLDPDTFDTWCRENVPKVAHDLTAAGQKARNEAYAKGVKAWGQA